MTFSTAGSRRQFLKQASCGFGYLALAGLATQEAAASGPLAARAPHFTPRAKRVIFLFMDGGPSHVDTFDYKPKLNADAGRPFRNQAGRMSTLLPTPWAFRQRGESGLWISDLFPHLARHADDLCVINSMHTDIPNHPQATLMMHTGEFRFARPSLGAWTLYGLGTENQDLPGFIFMGSPPNGGVQNYASAFLPASFQATPLRQGERMDNLTAGNLDAQRRELDLTRAMDSRLLERQRVNPHLEGVIHSFELGFRMQSAVPRLLDLRDETRETQALYGIDRPETSDFGRKCLLARRFAEAGTRFIEISSGSWDHHQSVSRGLTENCLKIDRPIASLLTDLKRRGLLDDTLVVWGGEFGRTPVKDRGTDGRGHNATGYTMWLAGGGVKGGLRFGATDDYGANAVTDKVHVHDLHATILHLLGLDHQRLTYRYSGRNYSLTDVHDARVAREIIA
jgi:hypothetical protein